MGCMVHDVVIRGSGNRVEFLSLVGLRALPLFKSMNCPFLLLYISVKESSACLSEHARSRLPGVSVLCARAPPSERIHLHPQLLWLVMLTAGARPRKRRAFTRSDARRIPQQGPCVNSSRPTGMRGDRENTTRLFCER